MLIDFWTYSCINCLRTLPHLKAWYAAYHTKGLVIIGVHTPEFAFEHVTSNVSAAVKRLGITYPVVQDNGYKTWDDYANQYWPAEYLIDRTATSATRTSARASTARPRALIRQLLGDEGREAKPVADTTPTGLLTPETYLGYARLAELRRARPLGTGRVARLPVAGDRCRRTTLAYGGQWRVGAQQIVAGPGARLRLHFHAKNVYIVLGGRGTVKALVDGKPHTHDRTSTRTGSTRSRLAKTRRRDCWSCASRPASRRYSFTFG